MATQRSLLSDNSFLQLVAAAKSIAKASNKQQLTPLICLRAVSLFRERTTGFAVSLPSESEDIVLIAAAIGQDAADVAAREKLFEAAAHWFRLSRGLPQARSRSPRKTLSQLKAKLRQISQSARRLLKHLGVPTAELGRVRIEDAYNGPGNFEILQVLSWALDHDENPVVVATRRIGRLAEILEAIEAASELEQWAEQSTEEVVEFGQLTVPKGHRGDMPLNNWIAAMLAT